MRRFELVQGTSSKFWQIEQDGTQLDISWGRIGTNGQSQTKSFATEATAGAEATKLIDAKTGKGYAEVAIDPAAPAAKPTPKAPTEPKTAEPKLTEPSPPETAAPASPETAAPQQVSTPPWQTEPLIDPEAFAGALPSRRYPSVATGSADEQATGLGPKAREALIGLRTDIDRWAAPLAEAQAGASTDPLPPLSPDAVAVVVATLLSPAAQDRYYRAAGGVLPLVQTQGLPAVVHGFMTGLREAEFAYYWDANDNMRYRITTPATSPLGAERYLVSPSPVVAELRQAVVTADEQTYAECVGIIRTELPQLSTLRKIVALTVVPDEEELADEFGRALMSGAELVDKKNEHLLQPLVVLAADPAVARWSNRQTSFHESIWSSPTMCATLVRARGTAAVDLLAPGAAEEAAGLTLARIGTPEAVVALAGAANTSKDALTRLKTAVDAWPGAAVAGLSRVAARPGRGADTVHPILTSLVAAHPQLAEQVRPFLDASAQAALDACLQRLAGPSQVASVEELPPVLASPPWLRKTKKTTIPTLDLAPHDLAPAEDWPEGLRERGEKDGSYNRPPRLTPENFPDRLPRHREHRTIPALQAALEPVRAAVLARDPAAYQQAWATYLDLVKNVRGFSWVTIDSNVYAQLDGPGYEGLGVQLWNQVVGTGDSTYYLPYLVSNAGLAALPGLITMVRRQPAENAEWALPFGALELAPLMARAFVKLKTVSAIGRQWLLRWPEHAATALVPAAVGKAGEARDVARSALRLLHANGHAGVIDAVVAGYDNPQLAAAIDAIVGLDPLEQLPSRMPTLPPWWTATRWHRPVLASGAALPDDALDAIGPMLALPTKEGVYPGIGQVVDACTPDSLAGFGWDVFSAWLAAGAASNQSWAMTSLALIGDDHTARRLTPFIRSWPGEGQHKRAVNALDVLAGIGSDVALMQLNGIAQKVKFKALQDAARAKIAEIAENRGMTTDQLEDRLAPDLGLDEQGTMELDFGPRQFRVGFDESLSPFVRDGDGTRLKDLPKPRQSDEAELAKAATTAWKQLKKDARTVSSQQVFRFEKAMSDRRRWTSEEFTELLATHPLVRHVVRRLVWGVYRPDPADERTGGELLECFRVAEDGLLTTSADDEYALPESDAVIGVVHVLEADAADVAAFSELFADYEIAQPFPQLGRDTYTLTDAELAGTKITRWEHTSFPTGKARGLVGLGWRQGEAMDAGWVAHYYRDLDGGRVAAINLDPGMVVGDADFEPTQNGATVEVGPKHWDGVDKPEPWSTLHPITVSELLRTMQILTTVSQ